MKRDDQDFLAALNCHQNGQFQEAERLYRAVLQRDSAHDAALNLLGVLSAQTGRPKDAVDLISRAIRIDGTNPEFHHNLGLTQLALGDQQAAIGCFRQAIALRPAYFEPLLNLGNLLLSRGELEEAEHCFRDARALKGTDPVVHNNLGTVLVAREEAQAAENCFRQALKLKADYAEAHNGLGLALGMLGRFDEAVDSLQTAIGHKPEYAQAYNNLGNLRFEEDRLENARDCFHKALEYRTNYVQARWNLAKVYRDLGKFERALEIYEAAITENPKSVEGWAGKAGVLDRMRQPEECFRIIRSHSVGGPPPIAMLQLYTEMAQNEHREAEVVGELTDMLTRAGWKDSERLVIHFALGQLCDGLGRFDEAFGHFDQGNRLRPTSFDPEGQAGVTDRIIRFFTAERLAESPRADVESSRPVFIIGMPRSGTSLVEQILSSHKDVHGAGELRDMGRLANGLGFGFQQEADGTGKSPRQDEASLTEAAIGYLERLTELGGEALRVTDKMPYNFWHLGLITLLFPKAYIIHCLRDPVDTCLSCYFQNFARGNFFSFELENTGFYYREYRRLMAHWKAVLDIPILEVRYETHVAEPEETCRMMLDFLELDWDPACVEFHHSRRFTKTASRHQVRKPIYTSSSGRWRNYEKHLRPLLDALGPAAAQSGTGKASAP